MTDRFTHEVMAYWKQRIRCVYEKKDLEMGVHMTLHETNCDDIYVGALDLFGAVKGQSGCFGQGYPNHPVWENMDENTRRLKMVNALLGDSRSDSNIAMLYNWESCAGVDDYDYMHIHRSSDMQAVKKLLTAGFGVDIIESSQLASAKVVHSKLEIDGCYLEE